MAQQCALTTHDNPFDPFEQFIPWFMFDIEKGYNSCGRMMRLAHISDDLSENEIDIEIENAIDKIVKNDITNTYKKFVKPLKENNMETEGADTP